MSGLTDRIAEVLREHSIVGARAGRIKCKCGDRLDGCNAYESHAEHVTERIAAKLQEVA